MKVMTLRRENAHQCDGTNVEKLDKLSNNGI